MTIAANAVLRAADLNAAFAPASPVPTGGTMGRPIADALADIGSVLAWGADPTGTADSTAAFQAACGVAKRRVFVPPGTYKLTSLVTCAAGVVIEGAGQDVTLIKQASATAGAFLMDQGFALGGGVRNLSIAGPAPFYNAPGSSGVGIDVRRCSEGFTIANVCVRNFDVGIRREGCWSDSYMHVNVRYFRTAGIWTAPSSTGTGDLRASHLVIQNNTIVQVDGTTPLVPDPASATGSTNRQIGMLWNESGGDMVEMADIVACGTGVLVQPPAGKQVSYLRFTDVLTDTCYFDGWLFDGAAGTIVRTVLTACWGAYSTNGAGLVTIGPNLTGLRLAGCDLRENGRHGADLRGGSNIRLVGCDLASNGKLAAGTYDGLGIGAAVSHVSMIGGASGNFASALTGQRHGVRIDAGADHIILKDTDLSFPGSGGVALYNPGTPANFRVSGNLPVQVNAERAAAQVLGGVATLAAGSTSYLGPAGAGSAFYAACFTAAQAGTLADFSVYLAQAPGAGQSVTITPFINNVAITAAAVTISGAASFSATGTLSAFVNPGDAVSLQAAVSAGSTTLNARYVLHVNG